MVSVVFYLPNPFYNVFLRAGVEPATYGFLALHIVSLQSTALPTELYEGLITMRIIIKDSTSVMLDIV